MSGRGEAGGVCPLCGGPEVIEVRRGNVHGVMATYSCEQHVDRAVDRLRAAVPDGGEVSVTRLDGEQG